MKNVRIFFKKKDRLKFVSHLDMNRFIIRALRLSKIPIWYTEGFNPHPYVTFLLPLSLGFESDYDILDIRLSKDDYPLEDVKSELLKVLPEYFKIISVAEPIEKCGKIAYASYQISFSQFNEDLPLNLSKYLMQESIIVSKKTKKGKLKEIDLAPKIKSFSVDVINNALTLNITLPAGGEDNLNPVLVLENFGTLPYYRVLRTGIYSADMQLFK